MNAGSSVIKNRNDGVAFNVGGSSTTQLTVAGTVNETTWNGDNGTDGVADWDTVSANFGGGDLVFANGDAAEFDETFDGDSSTVNLTEILSPSAVTVTNSATGTVPEYIFSGTGSLTGTTGLSRLDNGILTISNTGINDYTGATLVTDGTLRLGISNGVSSLSSLSVGSAEGLGIFELNGFDQTVASLTSGANTALVVNNSATPAILTVTGTGRYTGQLGDSTVDATDDANNFSLVKSEGGTLNMFGATNSYNGGTIITGGTILITGDAGLGAVPATPTADSIVLDGGTLNTQLTNGTGGNFAINPNRLITLGPDGGTIINTTPSGAFTATYNGVISGTGALTKDAGQALVLGGANTYTGPTTLNAGNLRITGSLVSSVTVQGAGIFSSGLGGVGSGTVGGLTLEESGRFVYFFDSSDLTGALTTVNGDVVLNQGTLILGEQAATSVERPLGDTLTVIDYSGNSLTGTFADLPEGATIESGANTFAISYNDASRVTLTAVEANAYATFAEANITDGLPAGFTDDADNDGIPNGIEFILDSNPLQPGSSNLPTFVVDATNGNFNYTRRADSIASTTQAVEFSTDLIDWTIIPVTGTDTEVSIPVPRSNAVDGKLFVRLTATNP